VFNERVIKKVICLRWSNECIPKKFFWQECSDVDSGQWKSEQIFESSIGQKNGGFKKSDASQIYGQLF
jgi:hypothetical protein